MRVPPGETEAVEYVAIPADKDVINRRATDKDRHLYADAYAAFLKAKAPAPVDSKAVWAAVAKLDAPVPAEAVAAALEPTPGLPVPSPEEAAAIAAELVHGPDVAPAHSPKHHPKRHGK
jgi:hypothetical protein